MSENAPQRRLVVFTDPALQTRIGPSAAESLTGADLGRLAEVAGDSAVEFRPMFGSEDALRAAADARGGLAHVRGRRLARMGSCYAVAADDEALEGLAEELASLDVVEGAYVHPGYGLAGGSPEPGIGDFTSRQGYLDAAPAGLGARQAWTYPGGRGQGVTVVVLEDVFYTGHVDLQHVDVVYGNLFNFNTTALNHGTAVLGIVGAADNGYGTVGIAHGCNLRFASRANTEPWSTDLNTVIRAVADMLSPGDVLTMSIGVFGPTGGAYPSGQPTLGWYPNDYLALRYAADRGVLVFVAGGNGNTNLDDVRYDTAVAGAGFPSWWENPYRRASLDAGVMYVGAGAPPLGWNGSNHGTDRSRMTFSNYGSLMDAQGWGAEITTTGTGDLYADGVDRQYTDEFSGTSGATPMVAAAAACVQGALEADGRSRLTPAQMRQLLRSTGSAQQDHGSRPASQRIGTRPDLAAAIPLALTMSPLLADIDDDGLNDAATLIVASADYWTAPVGTPLPSDLLVPGGAWRKVGHTAAEDIWSAESEGGEATLITTLRNRPLRTRYSPRVERFRFTVQQWDAGALQLYYGANASAGPDGAVRVPRSATPTVCAFLAVLSDTDRSVAFYAPKAEVFRGDDIAVDDTESLAGLPLTVTPVAHGTNDWLFAVSPIRQLAA